MKTSVVMTRKMGDFNVTQRTKDGYFDGNSILNQWNSVDGNKRRRMDRFLESAKTKEFLQMLEEELLFYGEFSKLFFKEQGRNTSKGRTADKIWMHKRLLQYFIKYLERRNDHSYCRPEIAFFNSLESIVNSEEKLINIQRQYKCLDYRIDGVIIQTITNYGEFNTDKDEVDIITLLEFDEKHHKSNVKKDAKRIDEIIKELRKDFASITVYRIPEESSNIFLMYAIPYYSGVDTSYSNDKMSNFMSEQVWDTSKHINNL